MRGNDEVRRVSVVVPSSSAASGGGASGGASGGVQSSLTEDTFAEYLEGYEPTTPDELLEVSGGRVRYAIDTMRGRRVESTLYRLGGVLTSIDTEEYPPRYLRLLNPYASSGAGVTWSVQLQTPGKRTRLWYAPPDGNIGNMKAMRDLLRRLETGEFRVTKVPK
jgi:hypothetical protein